MYLFQYKMKTNLTPLLSASLLRDKKSFWRLSAIACLSVLLLIGFSCIQEEDIQTSTDKKLSLSP